MATQSKTYTINGMHCANCELLVSGELVNIPGVQSVKVDLASTTATVIYEGVAPSLEQINNLIAKHNYCAIPPATNTAARIPWTSWIAALVLAALVVLLFVILERAAMQWTGLQSLGSIASFFSLGIVASLSSCAALVGGLLLSFSQRWSGQEAPPYPQLQFHGTRIATFIGLGFVLGAIGQTLRLDPSFGALLVTVAAFVMLLLGVQMLDIFPSLRGAGPKLPKAWLSSGLQARTWLGRFARLEPSWLGAFTFLLPCGFTLTAQLQALASGNAIQAAAQLGAFVLGTTPVLLLIGLGGQQLHLHPRRQKVLILASGLLVIFFALYSINSQLNVLGWPSLSDL